MDGKLFYMAWKILLHVGSQALCVQFWPGIIFNLAVHMILAASFVDHFIRSIYSSEQQLVPLHYHLVAISVSNISTKSTDRIPFVNAITWNTNQTDN